VSVLHIISIIVAVTILNGKIILLFVTLVLVVLVLQHVVETTPFLLALDLVVQVEIDAVIRWILVGILVEGRVVRLAMSVTNRQLLQLQQVFP